MHQTISNVLMHSKYKQYRPMSLYYNHLKQVQIDLVKLNYSKNTMLY